MSVSSEDTVSQELKSCQLSIPTNRPHNYSVNPGDHKIFRLMIDVTRRQLCLLDTIELKTLKPGLKLSECNLYLRDLSMW